VEGRGGGVGRVSWGTRKSEGRGQGGCGGGRRRKGGGKGRKRWNGEGEERRQGQQGRFTKGGWGATGMEG